LLGCTREGEAIEHVAADQRAGTLVVARRDERANACDQLRIERKPWVELGDHGEIHRDLPPRERACACARLGRRRSPRRGTIHTSGLAIRSRMTGTTSGFALPPTFNS
jgi:hypothetical protein